MIAAAGPAEQSKVTLFPLVAPVNVLFVRFCVSLTPTIALPGAVKPLWSCAFRFGTAVVEAMEKGAVPVATVEVICCEKESCPVKMIFPLGVTGTVTVSNWPVTPGAVMLTLYVPGKSQAPQFPFASAGNGLGAAVEEVESVQSVTGLVGTTGVQGVQEPADVQTVMLAPGIGARKFCTFLVAGPAGLSTRMPWP